MRISDWSSDVCSSDLRKAADGLERHDARQRAIIGKAYGFQPMVEGADAEVAAQPFGDARPERIGIAAHGSTLCVMPMPIAAFCHAVPPPQVRSEEHTSELQSLMRISYAVFCLKKKTTKIKSTN